MNDIDLFNLQKPWTGTGFIIGLDDTAKHLVKICWLTKTADGSGRSFVKRRNSISVVSEKDAGPEVTEGDRIADYEIMLNDEAGSLHVMGNGAQTETVLAELQRNGSVPNALRELNYFPDAPHFTQRITLACSLASTKPQIFIQFLRKAPRSDDCRIIHYEYKSLDPGRGLCVVEYNGNHVAEGDGLQPFTGDPFERFLLGNAREVLDTYWKDLNPQKRHELLVEFVPLDPAKRRSPTILACNDKSVRDLSKL